MTGWIVVLFIIASLFAFPLYVVYKACKEIRKERKADLQRKENRKAQKELREKIISNITDDFIEIGWENWNSNIHRYPEQYERLKKAFTDSLSIFQYNRERGIAKVKNNETDKFYLVSKERCSCPDFRSRNLPCKHMYYLATLLADCFENGTDTMPYKYEDYGVLYGLKFSLSGRGQEKIKDFIIDNGGTYGNEYWKDTSAVINVNGEYTKRIEEAKERNIEVLSAEQLMSLFCIENNEIL